jgi:IS30 family transposase
VRSARTAGGEDYRACAAQRAAKEALKRPKVRKLATNDRLRAEVEARLEVKHSPEQIANRLVEDFPDDEAMRISHETIYTELYLQGRGSLREELTEALRTGRAKRRPKGPNPGRGKRGKLTDVVEICERPDEVEDRAVPGHWEGDLILGRSGRSQVGVIVERTSRFVQLIALPEDRKAVTVKDAIADKIGRLPIDLTRSLTWDRGKEMARHVDFTVETGIDVYFCDPHAPWQRGTAENTNGLLRQYLPRGTDLSVHSQQRLDEIADELNGRPRETLGWMTPSEKFTEFVAPTG